MMRNLIEKIAAAMCVAALVVTLSAANVNGFTLDILIPAELCVNDDNLGAANQCNNPAATTCSGSTFGCVIMGSAGCACEISPGANPCYCEAS